MCVVVNLYEKILVVSVRKQIENALGEERRGFRSRRGYYIPVVTYMSGKFFKRGRKLLGF